MPLCSLDEVRAERADTQARLDRLYDRPAVSPEHAVRREECRARLESWLAQFDAQIAEMEAAA